MLRSGTGGGGGFKSYEKREGRSSKKESIYPTPGE